MESGRAISSRESAELRHTLRTPINHIIGYAELLLEDPQSPQESEPYLLKIVAAAQSALAIVAQHLQRAESDVVPRDFESFRSSLAETVDPIVQAANELLELERGDRVRDIERIRRAAGELLASASGAPRFAFRQLEAGADYRETGSKILARILIIDDSEASRDMLCRLLERQGHACVTVANGSEALARLKPDAFDIVLLDLMMPGMNGVDTLRAIKADPQYQELAVVMLSAFDEVNEIGECLEAGAEDYLLKPFDRIVLNARLHAILERKRLRNLERRRTLELERADAELRRSNEELRRFASVVSHDLQEPLRMVTSYMQLLERDLGPNISEDQREYLSFAIDGGRRMGELIQDLLAYSRVSAGTPSREIIDMNDILQDVKIHLRASIEESGADIVSSALPKVAADSSQTRQLLQNLVSNAIKYRSERPPVIRITAKRIDSYWLFSVADNGMGIGPEHRHRIFEMFSRLHDRTVPGTGIGLSICQRVVEGMGGRIWVDSVPGQGSTFYFTIPASLPSPDCQLPPRTSNR
jgi:signal transduction histidine kinase